MSYRRHIFARVPKTGSTSLMNVAYELQAENRQDPKVWKGADIIFDICRFRVVGVHVTQFKHQLTLQDQLEVNKDISTEKSHHNDIMDNKPSGRSEHDPLVAGDACAVPRPLRPLQLAQTGTHNLPHIHQPHKVGSLSQKCFVIYWSYRYGYLPKLLLDS